MAEQTTSFTDRTLKFCGEVMTWHMPSNIMLKNVILNSYIFIKIDSAAFVHKIIDFCALPIFFAS